MAYNLVRVYPSRGRPGVFRNLFDVITESFYYRNRIATHALEVKMSQYKEVFYIDTSSGNTTISLPDLSPKKGDYFTVIDSTGYASTNTILVDFESRKQRLYTEIQNCTINTNHLSVDFVYIGDENTGWIIK